MDSPSWPAPPPPIPWKWECHRCHATFLLSCTRRCLICSHVFCQRTVTNQHVTTRSPLPPSSNPSLRRRSRKRKPSGPCASKFDYDGWAAHGSWRRMTLLQRALARRNYLRDISCGHQHPRLGRSSGPQEEDSGRGGAQRTRQLERAAYLAWLPRERQVAGGARLPGGRLWMPRGAESQAEVLRRKEEMFLAGRHDCSVHCDYPNECGHALWTAGLRMAAEVLGGDDWAVDSLCENGVLEGLGLEEEGIDDEEKEEQTEQQEMEEELAEYEEDDFDIFHDQSEVPEPAEGCEGHMDEEMGEDGAEDEYHENWAGTVCGAGTQGLALATCANTALTATGARITALAEADDYLNWIDDCDRDGYQEESMKRDFSR